MAWTGRPLPAAELDGRDITTLLTKRNATSPHDELVLFNNEQVVAVRTDRWKLAARSYYRTLDFPMSAYSNLLFDLRADPAESYDVSSLHPDVVADMTARLERARTLFEPMGTHPPPPKVGGK
jgi:arylsulfatase A-like enzyme